MSSFTAIEVDKLPAPDIFEQRPFEAILAERLAEFRRLCPEYTADVESDPIMKLLQAGAYRELVLREQFNQRARGLLLPYSMGADLDNLAVPFGVNRGILSPGSEDGSTPPIYESDTAFRRRIQLAPESLSVAGPEGAYIFHTLSAHPDVLDASVASPTPGTVVVTVLSRTGDGTPTSDLLAAVESALMTVRPLTDLVTAVPAKVKLYQIRAQLVTFNGPDSDLVLAEARRRLSIFMQEGQRLGRDVPLSAIYSVLHVDGVHSVRLESPDRDLRVDSESAPFCSHVELIHGGIDD